MKPKVIALIAITVCGRLGAEQFTPLVLPTLTENILNWTDGAAYAPLYPSSAPTLGGIPFSFQTDGRGNNIFYGGSLGAPVSADLHIPVGIYGATAVYTLINTAYGTSGSVVGSVTFNGTGGLTYQLDLVEGFNVRDHYWGGFENGTSDPSTTQAVYGINAPGNAHYDMQKFTLPAGFSSETLTEIIFSSTGVGFPNGKPFLAAATVASTSVPDTGGTLGLLSLSLVGMAWLTRRGFKS
ncbi:MAG TPA: hypothetical protein PLX89_25935 [Verrucomicrobiota bacterium]|nr:hypothetical protein [Verrucomicrobiales bacterium]HRI16449.1 hypothetical protein [Verrucomicrobiota bacterium]